MALRIKGPLSEAVPQETEMADQKNAPSNGLVRYPDGKARRIGVGDPIPKGATFEGADGEPKKATPPAKTKAPGPTETTQSAGPAEKAAKTP